MVPGKRKHDLHPPINPIADPVIKRQRLVRSNKHATRHKPASCHKMENNTVINTWGSQSGRRLTKEAIPINRRQNKLPEEPFYKSKTNTRLHLQINLLAVLYQAIHEESYLTNSS